MSDDSFNIYYTNFYLYVLLRTHIRFFWGFCLKDNVWKNIFIQSHKFNKNIN